MHVLLLLVLAAAPRIDLHVDASEAEQVLHILDKRAAGETVGDADWQALFATRPYQRLKQREAAFHRDFSDDDFRRFVESLDARRLELRATLEAWKNADLHAAAERSLRYLPPEALLRASVYPVIKPAKNSFVFEPSTDPAIFLYVNPAVPPRQFQNTVAHELHHIGMASLDAAYARRVEALSPPAKKAAMWMGAFGEGIAMLAAAGSPDVHPLADFPVDERRRWDESMKSFPSQLASLDRFFRDVLDGSFKNLDDADREAATFFGERGPWYVVGYRMAVAIETELGRAALVDTLRDPRQFVARYNEAATRQKLPMFSNEVIAGVTAPHPAFGHPLPAGAGRGVGREVLRPACGEKVARSAG